MRSRRWRAPVLVTISAGLALAVGGCGALVPPPGPRVVSPPPPSVSASARATTDPEIERLRNERDALLRRLAQDSASPRPGGQPSSKRRSSITTSGARGQKQSFEQLAASIGGRVGIAFAPLGQSGTVTAYGALRTGVGWSTTKVPLSIAVVRADAGRLTASDRRAMTNAITQSDNAAAMRLWARLGSGSRAASATEAVLRSAGDPGTTVPSERRRAGYTPFGQTVWSMANQASFAAALPCLTDSGPVRELMGQIVPSQRWGLGRLNGTEAFKGGWGPDPTGRYLVRQFGVVRLADGSRIGVAIAAEPADGSFSTGTRDLNRLADWVAANVKEGRRSC